MEVLSSKHFGNYAVYSDGSVFSYRSAKFLRHSANKKGYFTVALYSDAGLRTYSIHRLVAECFMEEPRGRQINHKDGNKANNCVSNLEWVTSKENNEHARRTGLRGPKAGYDALLSWMKNKRAVGSEPK